MSDMPYCDVRDWTGGATLGQRIGQLPVDFEPGQEVEFSGRVWTVFGLYVCPKPNYYGEHDRFFLATSRGDTPPGDGRLNV